MRRHEVEPYSILDGVGVKIKGESSLMTYSDPFPSEFIGNNEIAVGVET